VLLASAPIFAKYSTSVYDFPNMALFTLGIFLILTERWKLYWGLLPIAILNKETAILLPLVFLATQIGRMEHRSLITRLVGQLALCSVVIGVLLFIFRHQPGEIVEPHWSHNLAELRRLSTYFRFEDLQPCPLFPHGLSVPIPVGLNVMLIVGVGAVIGAGWGETPSLATRAFASFFLPLLGFTLLFAVVSELRDYYEALPMIVVLAFGGIVKFWRLGQRFSV